jgi:capsular polysaccharide biosynthesis protein
MTAVQEFVRRRAWIVLACLVIALGAAGAIEHTVPVSYSASAALLVPSGFNANGPGAASEADNLAATYSTVLPEDSQVQQLVAAASGVPPTEIPKHLSITVATGSSVLDVTLSAPSPTGALAGLKALVSAVTGRPPVVSAVATGSLLPIHVDATATRTSTSLKKGLALGGAIGLIIGIVGAIAWDRADPHIDRLEDLRAELADCPAWKGTGSPEMLSSMVDMWRAGPDHAVEVALLGIGAPHRDQLDQLAANFPAGTPVHRVDIDPEAGGLLPTQHQRLVLAVARRVPTARVRAVVHQLRELEIEPALAFLLDSGSRFPTPAVTPRSGRDAASGPVVQPGEQSSPRELDGLGSRRLTAERNATAEAPR